jgi:probable rRNA maturation factor
MSKLRVRNRQRCQDVNVRLLRQIGQAALGLVPGNQASALRQTERVDIHLVSVTEMTHVNETYLRHQGSTDVITFDYGPAHGAPGADHEPRGEILICLDEALAQARRLGNTWQAELIRYMVHGLLHLGGYDDQVLSARRIMKREENRVVRQLSRCFDLSALGKRRVV